MRARRDYDAMYVVRPPLTWAINCVLVGMMDGMRAVLGRSECDWVEYGAIWVPQVYSVRLARGALGAFHGNYAVVGIDRFATRGTKYI